MRTFSNCFRKAMKSAHSCTLSNEFKHLSTCCVYFLNFGSDAYVCCKAAIQVRDDTKLNVQRFTVSTNHDRQPCLQCASRPCRRCSLWFVMPYFLSIPKSCASARRCDGKMIIMVVTREMKLESLKRCCFRACISQLDWTECKVRVACCALPLSRCISTCGKSK